MKDSRRLAVVWALLLGATIVTVVTAAITAVAVIAVRMIIVPPRSREEDVKIVAVDKIAQTITLERTCESEVDGRYSFWFLHGSGHARIGKVLQRSSDTFTRELLSVERGNLGLAHRGRVNGWYFLSPSDLPVAHQEIALDTELGPAPAWLIPPLGPLQTLVPRRGRASADHWVIQVHGRAVTRAETLRAVPVFRAAGYCSLLISYRNDGDAPSSHDGLYALGDTEWRDVDSAVKYAVERGAKSIVLMGWSMGGAAVLQTVTRSELAPYISGVVLDSPVIDWMTALDFQAKSKGINRPLRSLVYAMLGSRWGSAFTGQREPINFARLNFVRRADELQVPILILHSEADDYVISAASQALAAARPDIVCLVLFKDAVHTRLWNRNPNRWNSSISEWLWHLEP